MDKLLVVIIKDFPEHELLFHNLFFLVSLSVFLLFFPLLQELLFVRHLRYTLVTFKLLQVLNFGPPILKLYFFAILDVFSLRIYRLKVQLIILIDRVQIFLLFFHKLQLCHLFYPHLVFQILALQLLHQVFVLLLLRHDPSSLSCFVLFKRRFWENIIVLNCYLVGLQRSFHRIILHPR